jgi:hypothetical protein
VNLTKRPKRRWQILHIEEARAFSHEIGGTDADVKRYFFSLSGSTLDEIFLTYGNLNGNKSELLRETNVAKVEVSIDSNVPASRATLIQSLTVEDADGYETGVSR